MSDQAKDLRKVCILNIKETDGDDEIRMLCEKFGRVIHFNRPGNKRVAFALYGNESDAQRAKDGIIAESGYRADFANARPKNDDDSSRARADYEFRQRRSSGQASSQQGSQQTLASNENGIEADLSELSNRPYGKCIRCGDKAYHNCGRCGDFYCSEECQASDWLRHKRECFPMPKLVPTKSTFSLHAAIVSNSTEIIKSPQIPLIKGIDTVEKLSSTPPPPKINATVKSKADTSSDISSTSAKRINETNAENVVSSPRARLLSKVSNGRSPSRSMVSSPTAAPTVVPFDGIRNDSEVFITYVKSHQVIYVRSAASDDNYKKLITEVTLAAETSPKLTAFPNREDIVMAPYDGAYYRSIVIKCDRNTNEVNVGFIDFGNSAVVLYQMLKQMPTELKNRPRMTIKVTLKDVHNDFEQNEIKAMIDHLQGLCDDETKLKITCDNPKVETNEVVELFDMISNRSLNNTLIKFAKKRYRLEDLEHTIVNSAEEMMLVNVGPELIYKNILTCIPHEKLREFMNYDNKIQTYGRTVKNAPAYQPKVKELCLLAMKEEDGDAWYRVQYQQELVDEKAQVYSFDYGRVHKIHANQLRALPESLAHKIMSFIGYIKDGDQLSREELEKYAEAFLVKSIAYEEENEIHVFTV